MECRVVLGEDRDLLPMRQLRKVLSWFALDIRDALLRGVVSARGHLLATRSDSLQHGCTQAGRPHVNDSAGREESTRDLRRVALTCVDGPRTRMARLEPVAYRAGRGRTTELSRG